jgi:hypothetical protein
MIRTRAEYKRALEAWRNFRVSKEDIVNYEWRHGLRYLVWYVRSDVPGSESVHSKFLTKVDALWSATRRAETGMVNIRVTHAVRKPKGSP